MKTYTSGNEHPKFSCSNWRWNVAQGSTDLGYSDWVAYKISEQVDTALDGLTLLFSSIAKEIRDRIDIDTDIRRVALLEELSHQFCDYLTTEDAINAFLTQCGVVK